MVYGSSDLEGAKTLTAKMTPAGYMAKTVTPRPKWIKTLVVENIYSVSGCTSPLFADFIDEWKHNGFWFFNSPEDIVTLAATKDIDLSETNLFYYEIFPKEFDERTKTWSIFNPESSLHTNVETPTTARLEGYDVATFSARNMPECSPLSCNALADEIAVNRHCLLHSFEYALDALESGKFCKCEEGPFRIFAVYSVEAPTPFRSKAV